MCPNYIINRLLKITKLSHERLSINAKKNYSIEITKINYLCTWQNKSNISILL
jgi:hypothetical protein